MSFDGDREMEEARIEQALRSFRVSVKEWSGAEFAKPRAVRRTRWGTIWMVLARPAVSGAMAAVLAAASVGLPVAVHYERVAVAQRAEALNRQKAIEAQQARERAAQAVDDADLLTDVDSDVAQEAPEAMQPLAGLMSDSASGEINK